MNRKERRERKGKTYFCSLCVLCVLCGLIAEEFCRAPGPEPAVRPVKTLTGAAAH